MSLPLCTTALGRDWIDGGTLCRSRCNPPGPIGCDADAVAAPMDGGAPNRKPASRGANPPPVTQTSRSTVKKEASAGVDIDVAVEVVADVVDATVSAGTAVTSFQNGVRFVTPATEWVNRDGKKIVSKLTSPFSLKGIISVQTRYGRGAMAHQPSAYGRGTLDEDTKVGNTTLGFHESCHRVDFLAYLAANLLPTFEGKAGMTTDEYERSVKALKTRLNDYFAQMEKQSDSNTDEVGYKKSEFKKFGPAH